MLSLTGKATETEVLSSETMQAMTRSGVKASQNLVPVLNSSTCFPVVPSLLVGTPVLAPLASIVGIDPTRPYWSRCPGLRSGLQCCVQQQSMNVRM